MHLLSLMRAWPCSCITNKRHVVCLDEIRFEAFMSTASLASFDRLCRRNIGRYS